MADLTASNVTVTLNSRDIERLGLGKMVSFPTMAFGDGALTYPAAGIPMPAIGHFGMKKVITRVFIEQPANGFVYHFDRTNHKLRIYLGAAQAAVTVASHVGVAPTGNVANAAVHAHDLVIAANGSHTGDVDVLAVEANSALAGNIANAITIPGAIAANGGIANSTAQASGAFTGDAPANLTHTVTGGGAVAAGALPELDTGVAVVATTLNAMVVGQ